MSLNQQTIETNAQESSNVIHENRYLKPYKTVPAGMSDAHPKG
jgi:hypothetical protein